MAIGVVRPLALPPGAAFKHDVFEITTADLLQKDFVLAQEVIPDSESVMYNLSTLIPSEPPTSPRDYFVISNKVIRLEADFVLLPGDRLHVHYCYLKK